VSSRFRGFHTALATQQDYINALKAATTLTENLAEQFNLPIFPYSVFYIFFEQYLYISSVALICVGVACGMFQ
jgi:Niemann-Pick C1 protein